MEDNGQKVVIEVEPYSDAALAEVLAQNPGIDELTDVEEQHLLGRFGKVGWNGMENDERIQLRVLLTLYVKEGRTGFKHLQGPL